MKITLAEKLVAIRLNGAARQALATCATPLLAEMELLFSWLIRKRVGSADLDAQAAIKKAIEDLADPRVRVESVRQAGFLGLY